MSKLDKNKLLRRIENLWNKTEFEKCLKTCNKVIRKFPNELEVYLKKIQVLDCLDKVDEINECIIAYFEKSNKELDDYHTVIELLNDYNYDEEALKFVEDAIELYPNSQLLQTVHVKSLVNIFDFEEATKFIDKYSKTNPDWEELLNIKIRLLKDIEKFKEAIATCDEILKYNPDNLKAFRKKLNILKKTDEEKLDKTLNDLIDENNNPDEKLKNWALISKGIYDFENSKESGYKYIEKVLKEDSNNGYGLFAKGKFLHSEGKYDKAKEFFDKAIDEEEKEGYFGDLSYFVADIFYNYDQLNDAANALKLISFDDEAYDKSRILSDKIIKKTLESLLEEDDYL